MGFLSKAWKKVKKVAKPVVSTVASFIPGVSNILGAADGFLSKHENLAPLLGQVGDIFGARQQNAQNQRIAQQQQTFQSQEAKAGRVFNALEAHKARTFSADQAQLNRDFQERLSSTAVQRAAKDYEQAGFNPLLAMTSPSSTPSGSSAMGTPASSPGLPQGAGIPAVNEFSGMATTAINMINMVNQSKKVASQVNKDIQDIKKSKAETALAEKGVPVAEIQNQVLNDVTKKIGSWWKVIVTGKQLFLID